MQNIQIYASYRVDNVGSILKNSPCNAIQYRSVNTAVTLVGIQTMQYYVIWFFFLFFENHLSHTVRVTRSVCQNVIRLKTPGAHHFRCQKQAALKSLGRARVQKRFRKFLDLFLLPRTHGNSSGYTRGNVRSFSNCTPCRLPVPGALPRYNYGYITCDNMDTRILFNFIRLACLKTTEYISLHFYVC